MKNCPTCENQIHRVSMNTLFYQLKYPYNSQLPEGEWYFCKNESCQVVYINQNLRDIFLSSDLRKHTQKPGSPHRMICHCFGINRSSFAQEVAEQKTEIYDFIRKQMKNKNCKCGITNPSGICCIDELNKMREQ